MNTETYSTKINENVLKKQLGAYPRISFIQRELSILLP